MAGRRRSLEHSGPDSEPIGRIVREIVHINVLPEEISAAEDEPVLIDWRELRDGDGSGGPNKDTARTKR